MLVDLSLVVVGVLALSWAADRFVAGAVGIATRLHLSHVLVGAVVIGFGTSAPELLVSVVATLQGQQDVAFGNVVGSNTANVLLVLAITALIAPAAVDAGTRRRELPVSVASVGLLGLALVDARVTLAEGIGLLLAGAVALSIIVTGALRDRRAAARYAQEVGETADDDEPAVGRAVGWSLVGLVGVVAGAEVLVRGAVGLATDLGVSSALVGLTVVAIGTSLPELVTAVAAARKGASELVVGNVLGSNVFNSLLVGAVAGVLRTTDLDPTFRANVLVMVLAMVVTAALILRGGRLARPEAAVLGFGFVAWVGALGAGVLE